MQAGVQKKETTTKVNFSEHNHVQHHPKEKKFTGMFSMGPSKKSLDAEISSTKTVLKSILKGSNKVFQLRSTAEEEKSSQVGLSEGFGNIERISVTKKQAETDLMRENNGPGLPRPNSSKAMNARSATVKAGLSTTKDAQTDLSETMKGSGGTSNIQNIQGNIIHITVNNYITNTNFSNDNGANDVKESFGNRTAFPDEKRPNRIGTSTSSKELSTNKALNTSNREDTIKLPGKKGISPSSNYERKTVTNFNRGFSSTTTTIENSKKIAANNPLNEEGFQNSTFKRVSTADKASLIVIGNQNLSKTFGASLERKNDSNSYRSIHVTQTLDQEWSSVGPNNLSTKSNQTEYKTPTYYKYLNPGQSGPVRPTQGFGLKGQAVPEKDFSSASQNFETKPSISNLKEKQIARPTTAPDQQLAFTLKNSPYLQTTTTTKTQGRQGRTIETTQESRQSSVQPSKDYNALSESFNPRNRSISPGQAKTTLFNHFQEISNKPRWKF